MLPRGRIKTSRVLLSFLSFGVAGYAAFAYGLLPLGATAHPDMKANFLAHSTAIYIHAFASIVALIVGPLQFSVRLRQGNAGLHQWLGRAYLAVGVLVGGMAGLFLARYASGGLIARLGFSVLASAWLNRVSVNSGQDHKAWYMGPLSFYAIVAAVLFFGAAYSACQAFAT